MKYLLLLVVVAVVCWIWGSKRRGAGDPAAAAAAPPTLDMVRCDHCGVYLPRGDALPGRGGVFCDAAHLAAFERSAPPRA